MSYKSKLRSSKNIIDEDKIKPDETIKTDQKIKPDKDIKTDKKKIGTTFKDVLSTLKIDETFTKPHKKYKFDKVKDNTFPMQDYNFMVDLIQMPKTSKKYKYILVVVDIWSDEFDLEPLYNKTALETLKAFKTIIKRPYLNLPKASIRSDNGTEFKKEFTNFLEDHKIRHRLSRPYRHKQNSNVESLNRLVTRILMTYLTNKEIELGHTYLEWTDLLPELRKELNAYRKKPDGDPFNLEPIKRNDMIPKYNVGDIVIPVLEHAKNALGNKETSEGFRSGDVRYDRLNKLKIIKVLNYPNNNRYILNGMTNVSFAEAELLPTDKTEEFIEVKKIIGHKVSKGISYYLVWWKGLIKSKSTWELATNLIEDGLSQELKEFHELEKAKKKNKKKKN